ncbi:DUF1127 domain-containing protein [Phaeobacter sp.]|uniref:DUF1127 domain-containing protein n=1 Tax=Phaeobacter sp. TaxID=1902409 RepID=UPI0025EDB5DA|nr:DUF1127 domain-containing protein [Phaeobacter sp.]
MAHVINTPLATSSLFARIRSGLQAIQDRRALSREYNRTLAELNALSDRDLADIGIGRSDIETLAREHVYGA